MKYSLVPIKNRETGEVKAYASAVNEPLAFEDIAKQAAAETTVTQTDVEAVVRITLDITKRELLSGREICLGKLGTLFPTFNGEGAESVDKFTTSMIKRVNVRFRPSAELKDELKKAQFSISPTKKLMKEAVKDMKDLVQEAIDASGEGGGE